MISLLDFYSGLMLLGMVEDLDPYNPELTSVEVFLVWILLFCFLLHPALFVDGVDYRLKVAGYREEHVVAAGYCSARVSYFLVEFQAHLLQKGIYYQQIWAVVVVHYCLRVVVTAVGQNFCNQESCCLFSLQMQSLDEEWWVVVLI